MKQYIIITAILLGLTSCGRTIKDRIYPFQTVLINTLHQPVKINWWHSGFYTNKLDSMIIKAGDSVVVNDKRDVPSPFIIFEDSCKLTMLVSGYHKIDRSCAKIPYPGKGSCFKDSANLLDIKQYVTDQTSKVLIYRYTIGAKDSLEAASAKSN